MKVSIHEGFYYNCNSRLPTIIKEWEWIDKELTKAGYLACLTVEIENLRQVEYLYGSSIYTQLLTTITGMLTKLKQKKFREEDILIMDFSDSETYVFFLSSPRKAESNVLDNLETIASRIKISVQHEIFNLLYPILNKYCQPRIGYGVILKNPMIGNLRLVIQLLNEAKELGKLNAERSISESKFAIKRMIIEEKISTVFQPIVELESLHITGYEALSRGPRGTDYHSPTILFLLATECGLSFELDSLCRKKAFEKVRRLKQNTKIFVNTLAMTIHDPEFRGLYLKELLADIEVKPENVVFEISEKLAIDNYDMFRSSLKDYTDIGICHANDDIGTGHSGLERVMELKPGYMKVDISFVKEIDRSQVKQEILRAVQHMAASIGSEIIAEGVETIKEYNVLRQLGIKYGQGFLFGLPEAQIDPEKQIILEVKNHKPS